MSGAIQYFFFFLIWETESQQAKSLEELDTN